MLYWIPATSSACICRMALSLLLGWRARCLRYKVSLGHFHTPVRVKHKSHNKHNIRMIEEPGGEGGRLIGTG
jgi:hypothetical protein